MKPCSWRQTSPERLELSEGGGCLAFLGLPFFAAGCFVTLIGTQAVPVVNAAEVPLWAWPLIVLMGLVFMAVGSVLMSGRRWIVLDRSRGSILRQWGLLVPMRREELNLDDFEKVAVRLDAGDSDSADSYPVMLRSKAGGKDVNLCSSQQYGSSWTSAVSVARFLHLPLEDGTTDRATVVGPDQVGETFQAQLRGRDAPHRVSRPYAMHSHVEESGEAVRITIPGPGFRPTMILGVAIPVAILAFVGPDALAFFQRTDTPRAVQMFFSGFAVLLFLVLPFAGLVKSVIRAVKSRTVVTATVDGILIEERGAGRTRTNRIPAAELIGLDFSLASSMLASARTSAMERTGENTEEHWPSVDDGRTAPWWLRILHRLVRSKGITVKSRSGLFTFGQGLPDEEVQYLHFLLLRILGGARKAGQSESETGIETF